MHTVTYRQFSTLVEVLEERKKNLLLAGLPAHFSAMQIDDQRVREDARGMLAPGPSCVPPAPQLKREWSPWPEFGWIPANLCDLSKG